MRKRGKSKDGKYRNHSERSKRYIVRQVYIVQDCRQQRGGGAAQLTCEYNRVQKYSGIITSRALLVFGLLRVTEMVL